MASDVTIDIAGPLVEVDEKVEEAIKIFSSLETSCTRFSQTSPLMLANAEPSKWHSLPAIAVEVIKAAYDAYQLTDGLFDPRILGDLLKSGYNENLRFDSTDGVRNLVTDNWRRPQESIRRKFGSWNPEFRGKEVRLGELPIDLGGIGKSFAVERAMEMLQDCAEGVLINAGGDIAAEGFNDEGEPWRLGIENPWNPAGDPVLVVELTDASIATSSVRLRSWVKDGQITHHLIDPTTGSPGGKGLVAVSAIAAAASTAEVWSKTLFLKGLAGIEHAANQHGIAVAWIDEIGNVSTNKAFQDQTIWGVSKAPREK